MPLAAPGAVPDIGALVAGLRGVPVEQLLDLAIAKLRTLVPMPQPAQVHRLAIPLVPAEEAMTNENHTDARWASLDPTGARAPRAWPPFMTAKVAADYCDTSPWTIRRHVTPCGKRGRTFVYAIEAVEAWMRGTTIAPRRREAPRNIATTSGATATSLARVHALAEYRQRGRGDHLAGGDDDVSA